MKKKFKGIQWLFEVLIIDIYILANKYKLICMKLVYQAYMWSLYSILYQLYWIKGWWELAKYISTRKILMLTIYSGHEQQSV